MNSLKSAFCSRWATACRAALANELLVTRAKVRLLFETSRLSSPTTKATEYQEECQNEKHQMLKENELTSHNEINSLQKLFNNLVNAMVRVWLLCNRRVKTEFVCLVFKYTFVCSLSHETISDSPTHRERLKNYFTVSFIFNVVL